MIGTSKVREPAAKSVSRVTHGEGLGSDERLGASASQTGPAPFGLSPCGSQAEPLVPSAVGGSDWTDAEDEILLVMRREGKTYAQIAKALPGRTCGGCAVRWERLNRDTGLSAKESEYAFAAMSAEGSRSLLRAQLKTGQHFIHTRADHLRALKAAGF